MSLEIFTTGKRDRCDALLQSAALSDVRLTFIEDEEFKQNSDKLFLALHYVERSRHNHVMFVDGHDSIILAKEKEISDKISQAPKPLICAHSENWPPHAEAIPFVNIQSPWKFPSGGGYAGRIEEVVNMLTEATRLLHVQFSQRSDNVILHQIPSFYTVDEKCTMFQSTLARREGVIFDIGQRRVINTVFNELPCVLHCAGRYRLEEAKSAFLCQPKS
jgi:hypothetical protein